MKVGFIGLGHMGAAMASNILKTEHEVVVYNRTPSRAQKLAEDGAKVASSPAEASRNREVVFTMLADDQALEGVVFGNDGILAGLPTNAIHISSSTISVALSERLTAAHAEAGQRFIAAPVFGRPEAAANAQLFVVAAGPLEAMREVRPLFDAIAQRTFELPGTSKAANLIKLSGNFLIACVIEALGEAMTPVGKAGIDRHKYLEILTSTLFGAPVYKTYGALIASGKFEPAGFAAPLGLKDIRLVLTAADDLRVPLPLASLLRDRFLTLLANGGDQLDWSAISQVAARDAGA